VLMPFSDDLKPVYWSAIKPACDETGFRALRVDELKGPFNIHREIIQNIFRSEVVIADLTKWNPNVFYEMGVAHAIGNKTIMIIQKQDNLPFDVNNYNCIMYEQTDSGLQLLMHRLVESLQHFEAWRRRPTNPVQDFKPHEAFAPKGEMDKLHRQMQEKDERLRAAEVNGAKLQREAQTLQRELQNKEQLLRQTAATADLEALQKDLTLKKAEIAALQRELENWRSKPPMPPATKPKPSLLLRSQPLAELADEEAQKMLQKKDFFDSQWNAKGKGISHQYEASGQHGEKLIIDHTTGLMWQQSGSSNRMNYANAEEYISDLNQKNFAGYNGWRLPTLEEAMSLMEPKKHGELYIDPIFDRTQRWIWTADKKSAGVAWVVYFYDGYCSRRHVGLDSDYVRAVRGGQSNI
jgi:Protein of unknown function (DUF1566)